MMLKTQNYYIIKLPALFKFLIVSAFATHSFASPLSMSYSGRIVQENGAPIAGPVHIRVSFFDAQTDGNQLGFSKDFEETTLQEGIFQIVIRFVSSELSTIFNDRSETWIEIRDLTNEVQYPRQMLTAIPFALRIPVDNSSLRFSSDDGKLQVHQLNKLSLSNGNGVVDITPNENAKGSTSYTLPTADGVSGDVLSTQGNGMLSWVTPANLDTNSDSKADLAANSELLAGKSKDFFLNMDNMVGGNTNKVFTAADKSKLDLLQTSSNINAESVDTAGAVMESDLPGSAGLLTTDGAGGIGVVNTNSYLTSESDPQIGSLSTSGSWCTTDGSVINCDQAVPVLQSDLGTGANDVVRLDGSSRLPAVDGSQLSNLNLQAPGTIGNTTPNTGAFTTLTGDNITAKTSVRLNDDDATNYMSIQAPVNLDDDATVYTLPAVPTAGSALVTDGSGVLSWESLDQISGTIDAGSITGTIADGIIASTLARDSEVTYKDEADLTSALNDNYEAKDADLTAIAGFTHTDGKFIVSNGTGWVLESDSTARASLGLTIGTNVQAYDANTTVLGNTIEATEMAGTGTLPAFDGSALTNLDADHMNDGTTNKVYTATEKTKLSGIGAGADITEVTAGDGLTGGGDSGSVTLNIDYSGDKSFDNDTLFIDAGSNRVGIGTASPEERFHIVKATSPYILVEDTGNPNQASIRFKTEINEWTVGQHGNTTEGYFKISDHSSHGNGTDDRLTIDTNGLVGIGTDAPDTSLDIHNLTTTGDFDASDQNTHEGIIIRSGGKVPGESNNNGDAAVGISFEVPSATNGSYGRAAIVGVSESTGQGTAALAFITQDNSNAPLERMRIEKYGSVGIGTSDPQAKLDVNGALRANGITDTSDIRYKKDISSIDDALDLLSRIEGRRFLWRHDEFPNKKFKDGEDVGFIAQEVEVYFPELVETDNEGYKSVSYSRFVAFLVEALKELRSEKDQEISNIRGENQILKNYLCSQDPGASFCE